MTGNQIQKGSTSLEIKKTQIKKTRDNWSQDIGGSVNNGNRFGEQFGNSYRN